MIEGVSLYPCLALCFIVFQCLERGIAHEKQNENGDDVEPRHDSDTNVTKAPGKAGGPDGAIKYGCHHRDFQEQHFSGKSEESSEIGDIGFGNVVVGEHGRKCEKEQRYGDEGLADAGHDTLNRKLGEGGTVCISGGGQVLDDETAITAMHIVGASDQDDECCCRTDKQRIDVDREGLYQPLLRRMLYF